MDAAAELPDRLGHSAGVPPGSAPESLGEALGSVARRLRTASLQSLAQWEVTPSQLRALRVLRWHGVLRPSELSAHLRIAPRSTTEVVDDLVGKSLVSREPDPSDRRATLIELTARGRALGEQLRASCEAESERILGRLDETDRAHLARILGVLRAD